MVRYRFRAVVEFFSSWWYSTKLWSRTLKNSKRFLFEPCTFFNFLPFSTGISLFPDLVSRVQWVHFTWNGSSDKAAVKTSGDDRALFWTYQYSSKDMYIFDVPTSSYSISALRQKHVLEVKDLTFCIQLLSLSLCQLQTGTFLSHYFAFPHPRCLRFWVEWISSMFTQFPILK